jgi:hypothetical protein
MAKRRISDEEIRHVIQLSRSGLYLREVARLTGVSTTGVTGICARAGIRINHGKRGPLRVLCDKP